MYIHDSKPGHPWLKILLEIILGLVLITVGFFVGAYYADRSDLIKRIASGEQLYAGKILGKYSEIDKSKISQDVNFDMFWEVWDILKTEYVGKDALTDKQMFYGALKGLLSSSNDPYTIFMDPKDSQQFNDDLAGTFEGIGAELGIKKDILTIIAPLPDTPAKKAGLLAGDQIYAINGTTTAGMSVDEAVKLIRGPKDTNVVLTIMRSELNQPKEINITRGTIIVKSIKTEVKDDVFVIELNNFNNDTSELFQRTVLEVLKKNPKGIILDLRNNPGGYLDTAVEVASEWVDNGIVVKEKFSEQKSNEYKAKGLARLKEFKTVILVNEGSASASEIVAGALQDHKKAYLIGKTTFGKGSVQTIEQLKDGSSVKITVAEWLTPNGRNINEEGIKPDLEVELSLDDYNNDKDPQMDEAIKYFNDK